MSMGPGKMHLRAQWELTHASEDHRLFWDPGPGKGGGNHRIISSCFSSSLWRCMELLWPKHRNQHVAVLNLVLGGYWEDENRVFLEVCGRKVRDNGHELKSGGSSLVEEDVFSWSREAQHGNSEKCYSFWPWRLSRPSWTKPWSGLNSC